MEDEEGEGKRGKKNEREGMLRKKTIRNGEKPEGRRPFTSDLVAAMK